MVISPTLKITTHNHKPMKATIYFHLEDQKKKGGKKRRKKQPRFVIKIAELAEALEGSYMGLGTPYSPIQVDNFIDLENQEYASIYPNTKITAQLVFEKPSKKVKAMNLVCCKVTNIDRVHNDQLRESPGNPWSGIFKLKRRHVLPAPDGTLYIAPNSDGECCIHTKKHLADALLAYTLVFSATMELEGEGCIKNYYFVLDPVVKVNSGRD